MNRNQAVHLVLVIGLHFAIGFGDKEFEKLRKYSTKTTYENSVAQDEHYYNIAASEMGWNKDGCKPVLVVGLFRHGIRYPGEQDITNIAKVVFKMKVAGVAASQVYPLEAVANKFLMAQAKDLAPSGKRELHDLGKRFGKRVKKILSNAPSSSEFAFFSSSKSRAIGSCESFKTGFINSTGLPFGIGTGIDDHILRFFDDCSKYVVAVSENKSATVEAAKFHDIYLPRINERIAKKLGIHHLDLDKDEIKSLLVIAATEVAVYGTATWAPLLSDEDLELLEYASDIKNYWKKGYGYPINYEPSCTLLRHMLQHLEDYISCRTKKKAVFYFGHTETVIPMLSILGLFNDTEQLMADNYDRHRLRQFRTSRLSPFASNVAFVLSDCSSSSESVCSSDLSSADRFSVRLLFKERPLVFPACGNTDCPYSAVRKRYAGRIEACNFSELCWVGDHDEL